MEREWRIEGREGAGEGQGKDIGISIEWWGKFGYLGWIWEILARMVLFEKMKEGTRLLSIKGEFKTVSN